MVDRPSAELSSYLLEVSTTFIGKRADNVVVIRLKTLKRQPMYQPPPQQLVMQGGMLGPQTKLTELKTFTPFNYNEYDKNNAGWKGYLGVSWLPALRVISPQVAPSGTSRKRRTSAPGWKRTLPNLAM